MANIVRERSSWNSRFRFYLYFAVHRHCNYIFISFVFDDQFIISNACFQFNDKSIWLKKKTNQEKLQCWWSARCKSIHVIGAVYKDKLWLLWVHMSYVKTYLNSNICEYTSYENNFSQNKRIFKDAPKNWSAAVARNARDWDIASHRFLVRQSDRV